MKLLLAKSGFILLTYAIILFIIGGCSEDDGTIRDTDVNSAGDSLSLASSRTTATDCSLFSYPDSLFFIQEAPTNLVSPDSTLTGTYSSFPLGLSINPTTGVIDVNASETGLKYEVRYVPSGTTDTCRTSVIISGINYLDSIYVLNQGDSLAFPIYNANPTALLPCDDDDDDDDNGRWGSFGKNTRSQDDDDDDDDCEFDDGPDDDDGDGTDDEPDAGQEVIPQGVAINKADGSINLQQTLDNGIFGTTATNGDFRDFTIFYRLNDASNGALNSIEVRFYFFETAADVPQSIKDEISDREELILSNTARFDRIAKLLSRNGRPPYIVIVRSAR